MNQNIFNVKLGILKCVNVHKLLHFIESVIIKTKIHNNKRVLKLE